MDDSFKTQINEILITPGESKARTYHGQVGTGDARRDGEARRGRAAQDADGSVRQGDNHPSYPPDNRKHFPERVSWKHEQAKSYVNRWRNKARG